MKYCPITAEFCGAELNDPRRARRLEMIAIAAAADPGASFPKQAGADAKLEGTYRFLNNEDVDPRAVLAPHLRLTLARGAEQGTVLAVQDTTTFSFKGESTREGLGRLLKKGQGFFGHFCIGVGCDGKPLGTLGLETLVRPAKTKGRRSPAVARNDPNNEQLRWTRMAKLVDERVGDHARVIHVMDREADDYAMFSDIIGRGSRFVVRVFHDRGLSETDAGTPSKLFEAMDRLPVLARREINLSARPAKGPKKRQKIHPPRKARTATVELCAGTVDIKRSRHCDPSRPKSLRLNVVQVRELAPPENEPPVLWRIVTTEPVQTAEDVARVVDIYNRRWTIEEFFKALKTGCAYEQRQLASLHALLNALAIFTAVAWRMLLLRWLDRNAKDLPAETALSTTQVKTLRVVAPRYQLKLQKTLTVHSALRAIAQLGGHIRNNGAPGWIVLGRGFDKLLTMEQAYLATVESLADWPVLTPAPKNGVPTCDQS